MIKLYELAGKNNLIFSPYCWRIRLALLHKKVRFSNEETAFIDIKNIPNGNFKTVPVLLDGDTAMSDSYKIAEYLDATYPTQPSLFTANELCAFSTFIDGWANALHSDIAKIAIADIYTHLQEKDKPYFKTSREAFFGDTLAEIQSKKGDTAKITLLAKLTVLDKYLDKFEFLGGATPLYSDFIVFGTLQWLLSTSNTFQMSDFSPAVQSWFLSLKKIYDINN
ncbi:glutathione S-transferase N-terminal domain-containing protein [Pseudoalteromonas sp. MMG012]|uniref:glutathione S-transferase N-terminal domain-containing protein n=1 Tax=Pseudoalteromonas sp. MMG012 TaxID=2822686 RepID=UPI001B3A30FE|nr:glutathione S-transferase N-terminal domain-containing protein [Pseudoalteromonas sp. MMG012]MBQ4852745.1 glutathione S-transferase N-terminal domain-containing protein [Pseudoalteromonas sp. MMG012]